jgi:glycosyltransferase involved in cell wall biosynthesis
LTDNSNPIALLISIFFPPEIGGRATGAWNRGIILNKMGFSVFVLCGFPSYPSGRVSDTKYKGKFFIVEKLEPFVVIRLRLLPIKYEGFPRHFAIFVNFIFLSLLYLPSILNLTGKIDLVYARAPIIFSSFIGFVYSSITRSFFIYEAPDLWPEELVVFRSIFSPFVERFGRILAKISYSVPDIIITIGEMAAERIIKEYRPKIRVYSIPIGVDPKVFSKLPKKNSRDELLKKRILPYGLESKFIVFYSGLISTAQNVESLLYAADKLKLEKEICILIIGDGPEKNRLEELKSQMGLENVYLLSTQPRAIMPVIISAVDVCAISLSPEPIFSIAVPSKFYEYLSCCKPLIGICKGELANIIDLNKIGFSVIPEDTDKLVSIIKEFKNSSELLHVIENNCLNTLQRFSLDTLTVNFSDILKNEMKIHSSKKKTNDSA